MKALKRLNLLAEDKPNFVSYNDVGKIGSYVISIETKLTVTDYSTNEYNICIRVFFNDLLIKEFFWDFNCDKEEDAVKRTKDLSKRISKLLEKMFIYSFNKDVVRAIENLKP